MLKYSRPSLESRCVWSSTGVLHTTFRAGSGVGPGAPGPTPFSRPAGESGCQHRNLIHGFYSIVRHLCSVA